MLGVTRFSISTLLLATTCVAASVAFYVQHRQLQHLRDDAHILATENAKFIGELDIADPLCPHVVAVPDPVVNSMHWRWRVYLPAQRHYQLRLLKSGIPVDGDFAKPIPKQFPEGRISKPDHVKSLEPGECVIDLQVSPCSGFDWNHCGCWISVDGAPSIASGFRAPAEGVTVDRSHSTEATETTQFECGKPIPLLVLRYDSSDPRDPSGTNSGYALVISDEGLRPELPPPYNQ